MLNFSTTISAFWSLEDSGSYKVHLLMLAGLKGFFFAWVTQVMCERDCRVPHSEAVSMRLRDVTQAHLKLLASKTEAHYMIEVVPTNSQ